MSAIRSVVAVASTTVFCLFAAAVTAATSGGSQAPCRPAFVVPYSEQCDFAHAGIKKDGSPANVQRAFTACDRAQDQAGNCLSSKIKQVHVVALSALYRAISEQADIAMFAGQYKTAEGLLREELGVLGIAAREAKPGDASLAAERARATADLASTTSGECTERAYLTSASARAFARDKRFKDLEKTLVVEASQYEQCAKLAVTPAKRSYVNYISLVTVEEAGRAAQAAGDRDNATKLFDACLSGTGSVRRDATAATKQYLATLTQLCTGRRDGRYRPDQPRPLDQEGGTFRPLALPKT